MTVADDAAVDLLSNMLRIPSLCGQEDELAELLLASIRDAGFTAERDEVGNVIGTFGDRSWPLSRGPDSPRSIVILGHMDTVPGIIPAEQRDGALHGRGAVDAKGPLATGIVAAARAAARATRDLHISVIGAIQEEGPSVGARHLALAPGPDFLVIAEPGGWDSVVLGYKGSLRFTATITQEAAHTAGRERSAPEKAVEFWNALLAWCEARTPSPNSQPRGGFNSVSATLISMSSETDGLRDRASLSIGLRLPPGQSVEAVRTGVEALLPHGELHFSPGEEAVRGGKGNPLVASFLRAIRAEGGAPRFKVKTGTSDMNVVGPVWRCPMVAYGPGDSNLDHTPNEHINVDEYLCAIRVLTHVLEEL